LNEEKNNDHEYTVKGGEYRSNKASILELIKPILDQGKMVRFSAPGHSMVPFIHSEDVLSIEPIVNKPAIGDVVAFIEPERGLLVIHRVIQRQGDTYTIKGDNQDTADQNISQGSLVGKVKEVERAGKNIHLGLGPERRLIGYLSRLGLLRPLVRVASRTLWLFRPPKRS